MRVPHPQDGFGVFGSSEVQRCGRGRAGVLVGLDGHEVRLCDPCDHRVSVCARVSRVCPGSPRCLFTGSGLTHCGPKSGVGVSNILTRE